MKRSALRVLKDNALEKAVLMFARPKLARYGELQSIKINTSEKVLRAEMLLKGESEPITISRARYRLESRGEKKLLVVYDVKISKEWAQNLLEDRFRELSFSIPDFVSGLLG